MPAFPQVGGYTVEAELGRGAMGVVYRARDPRLDRSVAIKALTPEFASDETRLARFEREARLMAGLSHPNIATVYGLEHAGTGRFLVMELVEGETLAARLSRGRLPLDEALNIAAQIARGVEAAHERGVVHRDLKPGNVMLQSDGTAKVLDFGLARSGGPGSSNHRPGTSSTPEIAATGEGLAVGTPGYMSPEQARGREVDRRTDIFAFGCILFECLTGRGAFEGESPADAIAATLEREPDTALLPERTPARIRDLLAGCLAKDAKHRLRDIGDARLEIERSIERREWTSTGTMRAAPPARRSWRVGFPWAIAVLSLAAAGATVWGPWRSTSAPPRNRTTLRFTVNEPAIPHRVTPDLASLAITSDGSTVCYSAMGSNEVFDRLYVRRLSERASIPLEFLGENRGNNPAFSPDGRWVLFEWEAVILKIPVEGGQPVELYAGEGLTKGHCWTPRGIFLSAKVNSGLSLLGSDGGALTTVTTPDTARGEVAHRWPDALPDGRHVLFTVKRIDMATFDDAEIALLDLEAGTWRTVVKGGMFARYAPTGHIVFARAGALLAVRFDARTGETVGTPMVMIEDVMTEPGSGAAQFAIARDAGTLIYVPGTPDEPKSELVWIELDGTTKPIGAPQRNYNWSAISPDGTRIAIGVWGASDQIFVYDFARGTSARLTSKGNSSAPAWSRDGKRIVFESDRDGQLGLYIVNADGTGEIARIAEGKFGAGGMVVPFQGGDGLCIERDGDLWVQPIGGSGPARELEATPYREAHARVSPDGHWIAYTSDESGQDEVYVRPYPSGEGKWQMSIGGGQTPYWLPGSDGLTFARKDEILVVRATQNDFANARQERLMSQPQGLRFLEMMPDGSRFVGIRVVPTTPSSGRVEAVVNWFTELEARLPRGGG